MRKKSSKGVAGMRRFILERTDDETGMSGTGTVAEGVEFSNGKVCLTWLSTYHSIVIYDNIKEVEWIHGHGGSGKTKVIWLDKGSPAVAQSGSAVV